MMTLYHGSYLSVSMPLVKLGRRKVDFGQGFYVTKLRKQAVSWAETIAERKGRGVEPTLSTYLFDYERANVNGYRFMVFELYILEWLSYVVDCHRGGAMQNLYDVVDGGVANVNVIDTVEDFENGIITAEQALGQLRYKEINHQICILNQAVVDKYLSFKSAEIVKEENSL